jgi:fatty-acyl-CoA synthase
MLGLMQEQPLLISGLIEFARRHHHDAPIVSSRVEGDVHRYTYADAARRARQIACALDRLKLGFSDRVATLAWNGYRHFELYFGIAGSGRVIHTVNPRLAPEQVAWIVNHAEDKVVCFDVTFLPIVKAIWQQCKTVKQWIALCDADKLPADSGITGLRSYEEWIGVEPADYTWPEFDERSAAACATRAAPRATRRAPCTATARPSCTPTARRCPTASASRRASRSCRWCRCSTSMPGASPTARR